MANLRVDHVIVCFSGGRPRSYGCTGEIEVEHGAGGRARHRPRAGRLRHAADYGAGPRRAARAAGELRARPPQRADRSARADRQDLAVRHAPADHRRDAAPEHPALHPALRPRARRRRRRRPTPRASRASSRTSRSWAPPASTSAAASTGISIFVRRQMIYADTVRMGGAHVTSDICQGLQVSMQDAERLKTMHGGLVATGLDDREMIELPSILGDWEHDRRQISRAELIGVMRPRVEEILEEVRARLDRLGLRVSADPADRADRRRGADPRAGAVSRPRSSGGSAGSASRCGCRGCRSRRRARPSPRAVGLAMHRRRTRRTNAGISRCRRTGSPGASP